VARGFVIIRVGRSWNGFHGARCNPRRGAGAASTRAYVSCFSTISAIFPPYVAITTVDSVVSAWFGPYGGRARPRGDTVQEWTAFTVHMGSAPPRLQDGIGSGPERSTATCTGSRIPGNDSGRPGVRHLRSKKRADPSTGDPVVLSPNPCLRHLSFSPSPTSLRWRPCPRPIAEVPLPLPRRTCASVGLCETAPSPACDRTPAAQAATTSVNHLSSVGYCNRIITRPAKSCRPGVATSLWVIFHP
jgi:hypothetical protein